jgi:LPS sulfotransferase NodH
MIAAFRSFVILAGMRTGSNLLEANLNALDGVTSYGEVFNPHFLGKKNAVELFGITLAERDLNPLPLIAKLRAETPGLSGFRFFHDHDPRVLAQVLDDPLCAKIVLTRNPVDSFVSLQIARTTGQWKLADAKRLKTATVHFDEGQFADHLRTTQAFQLQVLSALQKSGQTAFVLDYEDLGSVEVLNGLARFLGVTARLRALDDSLKKQNPDPVEDRLFNPEDLARASTKADLFGLARTPIFEPRRAIAMQQVVAVDGAGLVFFPINAAPDAEIRSWMSTLGPLRDGFDQRALRQWKRETPGHRSFTVVRHPLLRAYLAFHSRIVSGLLPVHRSALVRSYKARLPDPGQAFADAESERRAFLIFLSYARLSVNGQCGQRVDAHWASQTAILQAVTCLYPVDLVIREDLLAEGLAYLTGGTAGACPTESSLAALGQGLSTICDDRIEAYCAAAYARDYEGFGFRPWRDHAA